MKILDKLKLKYYKYVKSEYRKIDFYKYHYTIYTDVKGYEKIERVINITTDSWNFIMQYYIFEGYNHNLLVVNDRVSLPRDRVKNIELCYKECLFSVYYDSNYIYEYRICSDINTKEEAEEYNKVYYNLCDKINKLESKLGNK